MVKVNNANRLRIAALASLLPACQRTDTGNGAAPAAPVASSTPAPAQTIPTVNPPATPTPVADVSACQVQDGDRLPATRLRAVGTEPFWGARIDGRCVTYSTPDVPDGTRIWTRLTDSAGQRVWTGALDGRRFVLEIEKAVGASCSDGMSDRTYPFHATLQVGDTREKGCAEPS